MYSRLFNRFIRERHLKESTVNGYSSALKKYTGFQKLDLEDLLREAENEEKQGVPLKERKLKKRLVNFRNFLFEKKLSNNTIKGYMVKVKTFYTHFEIELPLLPDVRYDKQEIVNYFDLPNHDHIRKALLVCDVAFQSVILFMSSSGSARAETLSLTVRDFVKATKEYHNGGGLDSVLNELSRKKNIVPTFYMYRRKTDKYYYTFCSPEASLKIVEYLLTRPGLCLDDKLFDFSESTLLARFQEVNDYYNWGFKGKYRFFRSHSLRKFHASNIGLGAEYVDALQGRSRNTVHETYIKTNPSELRKMYISMMGNLLINRDSLRVEKQEFTIVVNVFLSGKEYNII